MSRRKSKKIDNEIRDAAKTLCLLMRRRGVEIDNATREDAATLCLLMAEHHISSSTGPSPARCEDNEAVESLSHLAWIAAVSALVEFTGDDAELEAAALIRDGWCPGDPVVRLGR